MTAPHWASASVRDLIDGLEAGVSVRSDGGNAGAPAVLKTSSVANGRFDPSEAKPILDVDLSRARCSPEQGTVIISRMNTPALVGEVGYVDADHPELYLPDRLWLARPRHGRSVDMRWLAYYLSSGRGAQEMRELATGTSGSMKNIPKRRLLELELPVPSFAEQSAMATALADADGLISALERLAAKKAEIKQGMMQQLLTGQARLPGFTEPWCESTVSDLAQIVSGGTPKSSVPAFWDGGIAWCTPTDITGEPGRYLRRTERTISRAGLEKSAASLLPEGSILLCTRATIGALKIAAVPIATNQGFKSLIPRPGASSEFLYYKLSTLKDLLSGLGTGSTFLEVSTRDVAGLQIEAPPIEEQTAIARVLADADDQIDVLRSRLAKARAIKQGMMQELLSGRTTLSVQEAVAA